MKFAAIALTLLAFGLLFGCLGGGEATPTPTPSVAPTVAPTVEPTVAPTVEPTVAPTVAPTIRPVAPGEVRLKGGAFNPDRISVQKGAQVTWYNDDTVAHTVSRDSTTVGPDSGQIASGSSYSYTFDAVGLYYYHCANQPFMRATVEVTE